MCAIFSKKNGFAGTVKQIYVFFCCPGQARAKIPGSSTRLDETNNDTKLDSNMRIEDRVIPARFLVTLGHLIGVALVFKTKSDNVYAGLSYDPTVADVATANSNVNVSGLSSPLFLLRLPKHPQCFWHSIHSVSVLSTVCASWAQDSGYPPSYTPIDGRQLNSPVDVKLLHSLDHRVSVRRAGLCYMSCSGLHERSPRHPAARYFELTMPNCYVLLFAAFRLH